MLSKKNIIISVGVDDGSFNSKIYIGLLLFITVFFNTITHFFNLWGGNGTYSHGFISLAFIAYFIFTKRQLIQIIRPINSIIYTLFLLSLVVALLFVLFFFQLPYQIMFFISMLLFFFSIFKLKIMKIFITSAILFLLAMPIWDLLVPLLQSSSAVVVGHLLSLLNIHVFIHDIFITIAYGTFKVANDCSGLGYILVALSVSIVYWELYLNSLKQLLILSFVSLITALFINWIRIAYLVFVGFSSHSHMHDVIIHDHSTFSWYIFISPLIIIFYTGWTLEPKTNCDHRI